MNNLAYVAGWREWLEGVGGEDREGTRKYDKSLRYAYLSYLEIFLHISPNFSSLISII